MLRAFILYLGEPGHEGRHAILKMALVALVMGLSATNARAEDAAPRVEADYAWVGSFYHGHNNYAVTFDITLTNASWVDLDNLTIYLVDAMALRVLPHRNSLAVGTLPSGQSVQTRWTVTSFTDLPPEFADREVLVLAGHAENAFGDPVDVAIDNGGDVE
jgi:hypothetical protein